MARNLITDTSVDAAASGNLVEAASPQATPAQGSIPAQHSTSEVLAGAFPQWNLLPATPFLRRVR